MMRYSARARKLRAILAVIRVSLVVGTGLLVWALWFFQDRMSGVTIAVISLIWALIVAILSYALHVAFRDMPELAKLAKRADEDEGR